MNGYVFICLGSGAYLPFLWATLQRQTHQGEYGCRNNFCYFATIKLEDSSVLWQTKQLIYPLNQSIIHFESEIKSVHMWLTHRKQNYQIQNFSFGLLFFQHQQNRLNLLIILFLLSFKVLQGTIMSGTVEHQPRSKPNNHNRNIICIRMS